MESDSEVEDLVLCSLLLLKESTTNKQRKKSVSFVINFLQDLADAPIPRKTNTGRWCGLQLRSLIRKKGIENAFGILVAR